MKRFLIGLLFLCSVPCFAGNFGNATQPWTLAQIRYQVRLDIRDSTSTVNINFDFLDPDLNTRINAAQDYICRNTKCLYATISTTPIAGQREYLLPADCWAIDRVVFTGSGIPRLKGRTIAGLDKEISSWWKVSPGTPLYYYRRENNIGLYPAPSQSCITNSTGTIIIDYFQRPAPMLLDTDMPFNGDTALQDYANIIIEMTDIMCLDTMNETNAEISQRLSVDLPNMKAWSLFRYSNDLSENVQLN